MKTEYKSKEKANDSSQIHTSFSSGLKKYKQMSVFCEKYGDYIVKSLRW